VGSLLELVYSLLDLRKHLRELLFCKLNLWVSELFFDLLGKASL
jgi:hypothetical protein